MALKKQQEELPFPIDGEEETGEKIDFNEVVAEVEAEVVDEEEIGGKKYYTISGKEQLYESDWEKFKINELDPGVTMEGRPEITIFENKDKSYDAARLRILDDGEILDCYMNFPKKNYPYVEGINKSFEFYRTCFNFIYHVLKLRDERNVVKDGEEVNRFARVNLDTFLKYVDQHEIVGITVIEGNNGYNDWIIHKME